MAVKITCIRKDSGNHENPYVAITSMKWINEENNKGGESSRIEMHDFVKDGGIAYVTDQSGNKANLIAEVSPWGNKFVKTKADNVTSDNLLKLKEC